MSSYGYQSDHVNLIADNLRNRYDSGFPILKELIQNADDAKARRLVFGMHPGFEGQSSHPLLQGPGLWIFNDGQFKKEDERAIRSFGLNSKAGESGSIGKFGLGMKSVFHLCEAFFYVAFDGQRHFDVLLNPWRDPDGEDLFHRSWDQVGAQEFDALRTVLAIEQLDKGCESWFLMWIPLRRRDHVPPQKDGKRYGGIIDKYPGDAGSNEIQDLFDGKLSRKIRSVVPLLRNLESIELASALQAQGFKVQILFDDAAQRVDHNSAELISTGSVTDGGASKGKLRFRVQQKALAGKPPFSQFQKLDVWPKTGRLNSDGIREPVPDKSEAEGAVLVSGAPADGDAAKLVIDWAVFLPMEEDLSYEFPLAKSLQQYRIVLHGQFFVDSGRKGIAAFGHLADPLIEPSPALDDVDMRRGWNQSVAQKVILPQLLPTLAQFANDHLDDSETEELAKAIRSASTKGSATGKGFWETFKEFICHEQAWVRLITPDGLKWSYHRVSSSSRLLKLPPPPRDDVQRPWKVLPRLKELSEAGCLLLDEEASSLVRTFSNWDAETLLRVLDGVDYEHACSQTGMAYLVSFLNLEQRRYVTDSDVQRKLVVLVRDMLRRESLQTFRSMRATFKELVKLVNAEYRFAVGTRDADASTGLDDATLQLLIAADVEKLFLPLDLDPEKESASKGEPTEGEIRNLLKTIDHEISRRIAVDGDQSSKQVENLLRAAQAVLGLLSDKKDERGQAIRMNRLFRVLTATCARAHKSMAVSFDELQRAHQSGLLFKQVFGSGTAAYPVAVELAKLLPSEQIWVVDADTAGWIKRGEHNSLPVPSAAEPTAAYATLGKRGRVLSLAEMNVRSSFIRKAKLAVIEGNDVIRGMRYLLHGSVDHYEDEDATLWSNADQIDEVWVKLKRMVEPDSWNVIDSTLVGALSGDDRETLKIWKVGPDEVLTHLRESCRFDLIDAAQFSKDERASVLTRIADEKLWRSMPFHRDTNGGIGPITDRCFHDSECIVILSLMNDVRMIELSDDQKLREIQKQYISPWTHVTTIQQACLQDTPSECWELILDAIGDDSIRDLEKIPALKTTRWLPLAHGGTIRPEDVIDLEPLADEIDRLAAECDYIYAGIKALPKPIQQHPSFSKLKPLLANGKSALERLGLLMVEADDYSVGRLSPSEGFESLISSLAGLNALPAWTIVEKAIEAVGRDRISDVTEHLLKEIQEPLPVIKLIDVLNEISSQGNRREQHAIFNLYLAQLAQSGADAQDALIKIRLLARDGCWKPASDLCVDVQGVDSSCVLDDAQSRILDGIVGSNVAKRVGHENQVFSVAAEQAALSFSEEKSQAILTSYFKPWHGRMPPGPVGGLFALLGPAFRSLADEWLKPHFSFDFFSEQLSWNAPERRGDPVWDYKRHHSKLEALEMLDFIPEIFSADEIDVVSLLGEPISVPVDDDFDSLVVGNLSWAGTRDGRARFRLRLRALPNPEKAALSDLLRKTAECIWAEAYNQRDVKLGPLWETLEKSNQLQLAVAHRVILDSLPNELARLKSVRKNPDLAKALDDLKKLEYARAGKIACNQSTEEVEKDISNAKVALSNLMESNREVQKSVLDGIRAQVRQYQYKVSSIAFELLQNADDAALELQLLLHEDGADQLPTRHVGQFVMEVRDDTVRFMHWGRPINYMGHGKGRRESYGEDLQRMLILAASDKDEGMGLTGKFGLGFKSVLLATDAPCLLSGDLKVRIVGGCLPQPWLDVNEAFKVLQRHPSADPQSLQGTLVEFNVNSPEKLSQVVDRFSALAGLQCIFSKEIRFIHINDQSHQWQPASLLDSLPSVEFGTVQLPSKGGMSSSQLLNLRMPHGCLALRVGSRGFIGFPDDAPHSSPGIWVNAPTGESDARGVILNSQFVLDTGRDSLPHKEGADANLSRAVQLGEAAADLILIFIRHTRSNWATSRATLKLVPDVSPAEFWATFWSQIPVREREEDAGEGNRLLSRFGHRLFERFVSAADEIPNGLTGPLSEFVQTSRVCLVLDSRWVKLYEPLLNWSDFVARYPVRGWISTDVAAQLKTIRSGDSAEIPTMSVELLLETIRQGRCSAELMTLLSGLLGELPPQENELCRLKMVGFRFQAKDGSWQPGCRLLKEGVPLDERCIPFAPLDYILHPSYQGKAFELVQQYAPFNQPDPDRLAGWILQAQKQEARVGGLRYFLHCREVHFWIRIHIQGTWLDGLKPSSPYLADFLIEEKNQLLVMFNPQPAWQDDDAEESLPEFLNGAEALAAIRDWWRKNSIKELEEFYLKFWPAGIPRRFDSAHDDRASWMTLFGIGLMQRHGLSSDQKNRGFIDMMHAKGWWDVFCTIDPRKDGQAWLNVLKEYGKQQIHDEPYSLGMDNFPRLYRIARWFDVYTLNFQNLDCRDSSQTAGFLSPSADEVLSGSGIDAPSIERSLKLGKHIVVRELLRYGALKSETAKELAFKPGEGVRYFLTQIGFKQLADEDVQSKDIYKILRSSLGDDATFDGAYDIPLVILAQDTAKQQQVLGNIATYVSEIDGE